LKAALQKGSATKGPLSAKSSQFTSTVQSWLSKNSYKNTGAIQEPDWNALTNYAARVKPAHPALDLTEAEFNQRAELVKEVKKVHETALNNLREICTARVLDLEKQFYQTYVKGAEEEYLRLEGANHAFEQLQKQQEHLKEKFEFLNANQHRLTLDDIDKAYPFLWEEVLEDAKHGRYDIEANIAERNANAHH